MIWVLDGALQFQPYMFSNAFFANMLGMANMGLPGPVSSGIYQVTRLLTMHPVIWNALFASLQVVIGIGLMWGRSAALARCVSIVWALGVWVVGEGVGALFMPGTSALNGAPGAALLYAVVAGTTVPPPPARDCWARRGRCGAGLSCGRACRYSSLAPPTMPQ